MKKRFVTSALSLLLLIGSLPAFAQDKAAVVATSEVAESLDLTAVAAIFKEAQSLEAFEKALNDPEVGVNNLDLDDNGEVDFIRVVEEVSGDTHLIILQVPLAKNEFQDVATIAVEKDGDNVYNLQLQGDEDIYGANFYVVPSDVNIYRWPIITTIYRPLYRPYRSAFYFGVYPRWYRPFRPVTVGVYRTRTVRLTGRTTFAVTRTSRVRTVGRVNYTRRSSATVTRKTRTTVRTPAGKTTVTRSRTTTVKRGRRP